MKKPKLYKATIECNPEFHFYFYSKYKRGSEQNFEDFESAFHRRYPGTKYELLKIERVKTAKIKEL